MTTLLQRPVRRVETPAPDPIRPPVVSAAIASGVAAAIGLIVCTGISVSAWFTSSSGSFAGAMRIGGLAWLVGNGGALDTSGAAVTAVPLGGVALAAVLLYRAGGWASAASHTAQDVGLVAVSCGMTYALAGLVVWAMTRSSTTSAEVWRVLAVCLVLGGVFGGWGAARRSGVRLGVLDRLPLDVRAALHGGLTGLALMFVAGGVAFTASLAAHFGAAEMLAETLDAGLVGGMIMALISIVLVPNAVLCAGAFVVGSGFALGTGTTVSPGGVHLGPLPIFPLLAAVPRHELPGPVVFALFAVPMVAGGLAAVVSQRIVSSTGLEYAAIRGATSGVVVGLAFGGLTWLATGGIGPARMSHLGPDVGGTTFVCTSAAALGGALVAMLAWVVQRHIHDGFSDISTTKSPGSRAASVSRPPVSALVDENDPAGDVVPDESPAVVADGSDSPIG
jgi:hypothetical protein